MAACHPQRVRAAAGNVFVPARRPRKKKVAVAVFLRASRLLLRKWRDDDIDCFAELSAEPAVMQYLVPFPDRAAMDAWVAAARRHWVDHRFGQWVVELPGEASMIGVVGLSNLRFALPFAPSVEAAWRLARYYWGQGYAIRPHEPRSTTDLPGSASRKSSPSRCRRTTRRGGSWKSSG